jgi:hypothetical protein
MRLVEVQVIKKSFGKLHHEEKDENNSSQHERMASHWPLVSNVTLATFLSCSIPETYYYYY